ncbi:MAG: response regulator [Dehalococcoidia bacterium]|jgi:DNA-binding NarL/FixJ family response regulator
MENKVLIIDDEPDFAEALRMTLEAKAYRVITATNKAQGQDKMKEGPDVVVLGTVTPIGQAFSFHNWVKQHPRYKDVPVMVIDSRPEERFIKGWRKFEGMQLESDDYVAKPIEPASLVLRIRRLLEEATRKIRVLVADDHTMVRDGICAVLMLQRDLDIVGEAVNGKEAIDKVLRLLPDVALMDILMPTMSGLEATKLISTQCPQTKVLILTQYDEQENMLVASRAGAHGFIPKKAASEQLIAGIRAVYGGRYFPESFAKLVSN